MASTAIINALLCDGSGAPPCAGTLIFDDRSGCITAITTDGEPSQAGQIIDAHGLTLAPGFIDTHGHSDISLLAAPEACGKISQGITSEIAGNCGLSPFPVSDHNREHLEGLYRQYDVAITWNDLSGYAAELERRRPAINLAVHCGHNTLRAAIVGYENRPPTPEQQETMRRVLRESLLQGAAGFSTGLLYVPGKFAASDEVTALLCELAATALPYATHLRSEGDALLEAIDEATAAATAAGIAGLHLSHLKTAGRENWSKLDAAFDRITAARKQGLNVTADRYPYTEGMTQLSVAMPPPWDSRPDRDITAILAADPAQCRKLENAARTYLEGRWDGIRLAATPHPEYARFCGMKLPDIAAVTGRDNAAICVELLRDNSPATLAAFGGMSPDNLRRILAWEHTACGSDESARPFDFSIGRSHPRGFGSFPEFYRIMRDNGFAVQEIVRRFTSLPAAIFRLSGRGLLRPGFAADLVLFDPARYASAADFAAPHRPADGVETVFVNGRTAYQAGAVVERNGLFLRPSRKRIGPHCR